MFGPSRWFNEKTSKSKMVQCIISDNNILNEEIIDKHMSAYVLDMMAQIRSCINNVSETFEKFIQNIFQLNT